MPTAAQLAEAALAVAHVWLAAAWFGAMSYSLFVVQPRAERLLGSALKVYGMFCVAALGVIAAGLLFLNPSTFLDTGDLTSSESFNRRILRCPNP